MIEKVRNKAIEYFQTLGLDTFYSELVVTLILVICLLIAGFIIDRLARLVLLQSFTSLARRSKTDWDDILVEKRVFSAIAHLAPILFIFYFLPAIFGDHYRWVDYTNRFSNALLIIASLVIVFRILNALKVIIGRLRMFRDKPIDSYFQLIKIILGIVLGILVISVLVNKSIFYFFGALGAMTAVLLLVFKDTILGFIASIQLAANDMIRVGDWVQMDKYGADGDVTEINLTTVKVQNWDKTITTVPTYSFISDSFKNWRGMQEIGSRRIARAIYINQHSVKFLDEELMERFKKIHILKGYIEEKLEEIRKYNEEHNVDTTQVSNGRRMTNLGTFRAYLLRYLQRHPKINQELTVLVRQLAPTEHGIPIQIYAFCNDTAWVNYEAVQADIFDHTLAVVSQFDLEIFQNPSGADFRKLGQREEN
jgi:miniconductance mechanosensitive channel